MLMLVRARTTPNTTTYTLLLPVAFDRKLVSKDGECSRWLVVCVARATNTLSLPSDQHEHSTTPKGAKRLLKMACNKVCMTARCV